MGQAATCEELNALEIKVIREARVRGARLTNHAEGGKGHKGYKHSDQWKQRMSVLHRGVPRSEETKARISASKKGQPSSFAGCQHSTNTKKLISEHRKGKSRKDEHHGYRTDIATVEILQLLGSGMSKVQVADRFGVSPTFIHRRLKVARIDGFDVPKTNRVAWNKGVPHTPEHVVNWFASRWGVNGSDQDER